MNILSIDIGSYSVKFLESKIEKRKILIVETHIVVIDKVRSQFPQEITLHEIQQTIIKNYLSDKHFEGKIISQFPSEFLTTRYITLPVPNRKKAERMLPHQLEEKLPFPIHQVHFASLFRKKAKQVSVIVDIAEQEVFDSYYQYLIDQHTLPGLLTSELSCIQEFIDESKLTGSYAIIDLGHETTHCYMAMDQEVMADHTSHIAGKMVDEVISKTYQIRPEDAIEYKHQNCYLLTSDQFNEVDDSQREFAKLMKQMFWPLLQDLNRWLLGHRVRHGKNIDTIYLIGGTSNIKNCVNFFSEHLQVKVEKLNIPELKESVSAKAAQSFALTYMMTTGHSSKIPPLNFLSKDYATAYASGISLHSTSFILSRVAIICFLFALVLVFEHSIFQSKKIDNLDEKIFKLVKSGELDIEKKEQKKFRRDYNLLHQLFQTKVKQAQEQAQDLIQANRPDPLNLLGDISQVLTKNELVDLVNFKASAVGAEAIFNSDEPQELEKLQNFLKGTSKLSKIELDYVKGATTLKVSFEAKK